MASQPRQLAQLAADSHRARRDDLGARLRAVDAGVPGGRPSYDVTVSSPAEAVALAVRLEEGMALRWRALVAGTDDQGLRRLGIAGLSETAVRAAQWRKSAGDPPTVALPGTGATGGG